MQKQPGYACSLSSGKSTTTGLIVLLHQLLATTKKGVVELTLLKIECLLKNGAKLDQAPKKGETARSMLDRLPFEQKQRILTIEARN